MSVLQNPVIAIVVRWSASEASLRVENRRPRETVRADRMAHVEAACARLGEMVEPILVAHLHCVMHDAAARAVTARIAATAEKVTRETNVLFAVTLETDADRSPA